MLRRIVGRIVRSSGLWRDRHDEHHVIGRGRPVRPAAVKLPRHPELLLGSDSWRRLSQLADQRIRAHRGEHLSIGEMVETVSHEVEDAVTAQPMSASLDQWRAWAAATETPWPPGFHEHLVGAKHAGADDVEIALHVQTDLVALVPQLVAARMSENRG
ncbi:hypothetical protein [Amnibacterium endophyticum]|uniref:Uncharacterized protein n=1 Tax=Amnibacterium endophyticum TaxID=2109337 RepID=A0ABW4LHD4_9MICO